MADDPAFDNVAFQSDDFDSNHLVDDEDHPIKKINMVVSSHGVDITGLDGEKGEELKENDKIIQKLKEFAPKIEYNPEERNSDIFSTGDLCKIEIKEEVEDRSEAPTEDGFICEVCSRSFKKKHLLRLHRKIHMNRERINCTECEKTFLSKASLRRHLLIHKGESGKNYYCDKCGKSFCRSTDVNKHQLIMHTERIQCTQCEKTFYCSKLLKAHQVVSHGAENTEGVKIYQCDQCEKAFIKSNALSRHRLTHTGERNYTCYICGKAFPQSGHLVGHMRVHSEEKSYKCAICPKTFKTQSTLNRHNILNRHKFVIRYKSKKFSCQECG